MRRSGRTPTPYLAGWLFADLLLVLVLVVLGSQPGTTEQSDDAGPTPSTTASAATGRTPRPTASPPAPRASRPAGLDPVTRSITVRADAEAVIAGTAGAVASVRRQVDRRIGPYRGRTAAFVMVFATVHTSGGGVDTARSDVYATAVARLLPRIAPEFFPPYDEKIIRGYHDSSFRIASGTARIELFFLQR
ncbi:hypothetical protein [Streptomyces sp. NBC_00582]|uniref:hypothetical protein n=1 Tax=Streptomyces sp. NBC_00582 TaxID=2975783 RepID=UPI001062EABB|nr:hypothetical protein [Streptomyces sp. NBC_00582]WUB59711.1 hypothetical protein OG852_04535 [Streptomyces sp. NBC_00582]